MTFGGSGDGIQSMIGQLQQEEAERIVGSSLDAGINFIDTADIYADGRSEEITGQALRNLKVPRENVIVATKVFNETGLGANMRGATRSHIIASARGPTSSQGWCAHLTAPARLRFAAGARRTRRTSRRLACIQSRDRESISLATR